MAVTISLTIMARALKKRNVLCKSLSTLETLGAIDVLCSDKTGTLTENKMTVVNSAIFTQVKTPDQAYHDMSGESLYGQAWGQLWHAAALSGSTRFDAETSSPPGRLLRGDATDQAIFQFAETLSPVTPLLDGWKLALEVPFNPKNKVICICQCH
jgi:sodium/potassium-transporting ATPase subunit alpha